jgi:hypothetical protein
LVANGEVVDIVLGDGDEHTIRLKISDIYGNDNSITKKVQANVLPVIDIDSRPWVLTGKDIYPDIDSDTFQSYSTGYYVKYTVPEGATDNFKIFELKEKTNTNQPLIDIKKIENLNSIIYNNYDAYESVKRDLGLISNKVFYNFCIEITIYNENGTVYNESTYGASYENCKAKASTSKQVLVYFPPTASHGIKPGGFSFNWIIDSHPRYKQAEVTISVFQGGTPPPKYNP